jgi:hypothetical protein
MMVQIIVGLSVTVASIIGLIILERKRVNR